MTSIDRVGSVARGTAASDRSISTVDRPSAATKRFLVRKRPRCGCAPSSTSVSKQPAAVARRQLDPAGEAANNFFGSAVASAEAEGLDNALEQILWVKKQAAMKKKLAEMMKKKAVDEEMSILIVEHDLDLIWNLSEHVHFMAEGEILIQGTPEEIRCHETVVEKYMGGTACS